MYHPIGKVSLRVPQLGDLSPNLIHDGGFLFDSLDRKVCCTDLLSDTTSFAFLNVGLTDLREHELVI